MLDMSTPSCNGITIGPIVTIAMLTKLSVKNPAMAANMLRVTADLVVLDCLGNCHNPLRTRSAGKQYLQMLDFLLCCRFNKVSVSFVKSQRWGQYGCHGNETNSRLVFVGPLRLNNLVPLVGPGRRTGSIIGKEPQGPSPSRLWQ